MFVLLLLLPADTTSDAEAAPAHRHVGLRPLVFHNWTTALPGALADRALGYLGSGDRFRPLLGKLAAGLPISVLALGGSVTAGHDCETCTLDAASGWRNTWPRLVFDQLVTQSVVSGTNESHEFTNGAVPGVHPAFFALCLKDVLPAGSTSDAKAGPVPRRFPDLVLLELATNSFDDDATVAAVEALLRRLLYGPEAREGGATSPPAVLLVDWMRQWPGWPDNEVDTPKLREHYASSPHWYTQSGGIGSTLAAELYDIPRVTLKPALLDTSARSVVGLRWEDFHGGHGRNAGGAHASSLGHRVIASAVLHAISALSTRVAHARARDGGGAYGEYVRSWPGGEEAGPPAPAPLVPGNTPERFSRVCFVGAGMAASVASWGGWAMDASNPEKVVAAINDTSPRKLSEVAPLRFELKTGAASGGAVVTYLFGPEGGTGVVTCDGACACSPVTLQAFANNTRQFMPAVVPFSSRPKPDGVRNLLLPVSTD